MRRAARVVVVLALAGIAQCRRGGGVPNDTAAAAVTPAPVDSAGAAGRTPPAESLPARSRDLVVITLTRASLALPANAPLDSVRAAMLRGLEALKRAADFEILEVSPAIRAARVRAPKGSTASTLAARLRRESSVEAAEVEGFVR
jgi:hypothetical protein